MNRRLPIAALVVAFAAIVIACSAGKGEPEVAFTVPAKPGATIKGVSTTVTLPSAAGQPCVAAADIPAAQGKPTVNVPVGPPPTELKTTDVKVGDGATVEKDSKVTVNYIGISCSTGKQFDSSWDRGQPFDVQLGQSQVIPGFDQGIPGMKVGGERLLVIPSSLAYGATPPAGSGIAPDETLIFLIDVTAVAAPDAGTTVAGAAPTTTAAPAAPPP
jgi:peptidylprolyl isomerase